jgi:DNA-binding NarL/FixJ family response regulator
LRNEGHLLTPIRILITPMPWLVEQIIERMLASQPDMVVTAQARSSRNVATAARRVGADLVILRESQKVDAETPWQVLNENPRLKILAITGDGHGATRYELRPHQVVIDNIDGERLVGAIRAAVAGQG